MDTKRIWTADIDLEYVFMKGPVNIPLMIQAVTNANPDSDPRIWGNPYTLSGFMVQCENEPLAVDGVYWIDITDGTPKVYGEQ